MLVGLLTGYINLQYMLYKMRRADSLMQGMQRRKEDISIHSVWVPNVGKVKDADLRLCQDEYETNKRGEAEWDRGPW